jgi:methylenetetrahydrofolate dehydrogenase (NADP+)/methenyltetrahydrofolate cyclohydrolase
MSKILDGKKLAGEIKSKLRSEVLELERKGIIPGLAVVLVGDDAASRVYVERKKKACQEIGIYSESYELGDNISEEKLLDLVEKLNQDKKINGILVQLPLPKHINAQKIIEKIVPKKDVDCFHPENVGKMFLGEPRFLPCTPAGIMEILKRYEIDVLGKDCVVVGKSNIVGKPLAVMLVNAGATVTVCHSKTVNLKGKTLRGDILITAAGKAGLITSGMVKQGAVVIDVGINRDEAGRLTGDADFEEVSQIASAITPVPGGVGPMTIVELMKNTIKAAKKNED